MLRTFEYLLPLALVCGLIVFVAYESHDRDTAQMPSLTTLERRVSRVEKRIETLENVMKQRQRRQA